MATTIKRTMHLKDIRNIYHILEICSNPLHLISVMQNKHLINSHDTCVKCDLPMNLVMRKNAASHYAFQCKKCHGLQPLSRGTLFEKNRISYEGVLLLLFAWVCRIRARSAATLYGFKTPQVLKQYQIFREVCTMKLNKTPIKIGGAEDIVEVDENLYTKVCFDAYHKEYEERLVGLYSHEARIGIVTIINDSTDTLLSVITKHVYPSTTLWTNDCPELQKLSAYGYKHETFQQSGAHIEYMPDLWQSTKIYLHHTYRIKPDQFTVDHLNEYMWMGKYGRTYLDAFHNMLDHIVECYR